MFEPTVHWAELIARGLMTYVLLLVLLRITGKRQVGQLAPFDLVLLLVLSNAVQNAMNGGDNSWTAGLISATTLVTINWLVGLLTSKSKLMEGFIEGRPQILIHNGKILQNVIAQEKITCHELMAALRAEGCANVSEVHFAVLENNGRITVVLRKHDNDFGTADSLPHQLTEELDA